MFTARLFNRNLPIVFLKLGFLSLCLALTQVAWANRGLPDFTQLVEEASPAVVNISTSQKIKSRSGSSGMPEIPEIFRHFFGEMPDGFLSPYPKPRQEQKERHSLGSGFIISADGYLLTNNHVVANADEILVRLSDKRELKAEVIGTDPASDLALLKIKAKNLPVVKLGDSTQLKVGEWVLAIGSPFGFDHSVTAGIVSALGRNLPQESYVPFIQTDVAINPGNSGGPLFNMRGEVVGINSQIYTRSGGFMGLSFSIPTEVALEVAEQLKNQGKVSRGWLGVVIQDVDRDLAESFGLDQAQGALIAQIDKEGPAARAGLKVGDIILAVNNQQVDSSSSLPQLIGRIKPRAKANLLILREGKNLSLRVTLGERPSDEDLQLGSSSSSSQPESLLGMTVDNLTSSQMQQLSLSQGVLVTGVNNQGPAAAAGLARGDVLLSIDNQEISNLSQFNSLVKRLPKNKKIPLRLMRQGNYRFVAIEINN